MVGVDYVKDQLIFIFILDGLYDFFEEVVISFVILDKFYCNYNLFFRNFLVEIVEMQFVLDILQKMDDVILIIFSILRFLYGGICGFVCEFVMVLRRFEYLSLLCDMLDLYFDLVQMVVQKF